MRDFSGAKRVGAGSPDRRLIANRDLERSFYNQERFILVLVLMKRNSLMWSALRHHPRGGAACILSRGLHAETMARKPEPGVGIGIWNIGQRMHGNDGFCHQEWRHN